MDPCPWVLLLESRDSSIIYYSPGLISGNIFSQQIPYSVIEYPIMHWRQLWENMLPEINPGLKYNIILLFITLASTLTIHSVLREIGRQLSRYTTPHMVPVSSAQFTVYNTYTSSSYSPLPLACDCALVTPWPIGGFEGFSFTSIILH